MARQAGHTDTAPPERAKRKRGTEIPTVRVTFAEAGEPLEELLRRYFTALKRR